MKLGPKQQERIEGWAHDVLKPYTIKSLMVNEKGILYKVDTDFFKSSFKDKCYYEFLNKLKYREIEDGKINDTIEIAKLWLNSTYYKEAQASYYIDWSEVEKKTKALLSRKPYEDVTNFCNNIKGEINIIFDNFYEAIFNDLTKYYSSSMYAYRENEFIENSKATTSLIVLVFDMNDDCWNEINYPPDLTLEQFLNNYSGDLTSSVQQNFPKDELHSIIYEVNDMLDYLNNLNDTDTQIKVDEITDFSFGIFNQFTVTLSLSDKISNNQMKQLYELLKGSFNITVNLDYDIEDSYGYTNFDAQISYELTSIY
mgnify:CR=1 FL=1